jgi:hypothetical protein
MGRLVSLPVIILYGVWPDAPFTYLLRIVAAHSMSQVNAGCSELIRFSMRFPSANFNVLSWPSTLSTAFSTAPFDWDSPTALCFGVVGALLSCMTLRCTATIGFSWSHFRLIGVPAYPSSSMSMITLFAGQPSPTPFTGT